MASLIQAVFVAVAGIWALYLYRRDRRGQVGLGIEASYRLLREWNPGKSVLLVRLRVSNRSAVLFWHSEATATLMDARRESIDGQVQLVPFKSADPMLPVYGDISTEIEAINRALSSPLRGLTSASSRARAWTPRWPLSSTATGWV